MRFIYREKKGEVLLLALVITLIVSIFYRQYAVPPVDSGKTHLIFVNAIIINVNENEQELTVELCDNFEKYKGKIVTLDCKHSLAPKFEKSNLGEGDKIEYSVFPNELNRVFDLTTISHEGDS